LKAKLIAIFAAISALFVYGQRKKSSGKSEAEAKQNEVTLENVKKANESTRTILDPAQRNKLRDEITRK